MTKGTHKGKGSNFHPARISGRAKREMERVSKELIPKKADGKIKEPIILRNK